MLIMRSFFFTIIFVLSTKCVTAFSYEPISLFPTQVMPSISSFNFSSTPVVDVASTVSATSPSVSVMNAVTSPSALIMPDSSLILPTLNVTQNITPTVSNIIVRIQTSRGDFFIKLDMKNSPQTCENFLKYVDSKFYNNTLIHRVIDGFVIQMGGFSPDFKQKPTYPPIRNESFNGLKNNQGTVGMALTTNPHSATSQFYINLGNNNFLDGDSVKQKYGYTVFAKVIDGTDVIDQIKKVKTKTISLFSDIYQQNVKLDDVPEKDILILQIDII